MLRRSFLLRQFSGVNETLRARSKKEPPVYETPYPVGDIPKAPDVKPGPFRAVHDATPAYATDHAVEELSENPYRVEVLRWYRTILRAAFDVAWPSDDDAAYVLDEARRLFRRNQHLRDVEAIERKVAEAEARYAMAVHYKIPYPRMFNHAQGSQRGSGVAYSPYLDSAYDGDERHPTLRPELYEPTARAASVPGSGSMSATSGFSNPSLLDGARERR